METIQSTSSNNSNIVRYHLVTVATKFKMPFHDYKLLCEWLNCYQYVLPAQRVLRIYPSLPIRAPIDAIHIHALCDLYYCTLQGHEQVVYEKYFSKGLVQLCR